MLSQADVDSIVKVFEHGAGKSAFEKMERFDKLNDEIVEKDNEQQLYQRKQEIYARF